MAAINRTTVTAFFAGAATSGLVFAALATRWDYGTTSESAYRFDHWTGKIAVCSPEICRELAIERLIELSTFEQRDADSNSPSFPP